MERQALRRLQPKKLQNKRSFVNELLTKYVKKISKFGIFC